MRISFESNNIGSHTVRVAYDISYLAYHFFRSNRKTGVYRVVEELLLALTSRKDIDVLISGACHANPLLIQALFQGYLQEQNNRHDERFAETVKSLIGCEELFRKLYDPYIASIYTSLTPRTLKGRAFYGLMQMVEEVQQLFLYTRLNSNEIDIFHSPFYRLPSKSITGDILRVLTIYDLIPALAPEYVDKRFNLFFKKIIKGIDKEHDFVICISEYTKKEFCKYTSMLPDRVFVTPLAADDTFCPVLNETILNQCRRQYHIPAGEYFLTLAALQPRKNLAHLINSFIQFLTMNKDKNVSLVLVGSYESKYDVIFNTIRRFADYQDKIIFTGYVPDADLAAIYSGARIFLYPSLYEGFGLPLLEAMQCGVPVIASNRTSIPEVVGDAGLLLDPQSIDDWCSAMLALFNDYSLINNMRLKGLERAKQFSWGNCADNTFNIYKSILQR